jgi:hypothetical protein
MTIDYSIYLPHPTRWPVLAFVEFAWGTQRFRFACISGNVIVEPFEDRAVTWLHCQGFDAKRGLPKNRPQPTKIFMIPAFYITGISIVGGYSLSQRRRSKDIGVFPPTHQEPNNAIGVAQVRQAVAKILKAKPPTKAPVIKIFTERQA